MQWERIIGRKFNGSPGWSKEDLVLAQRLGYLLAGIHNQRSWDGNWTLEMLVKHRATHSQYALDPLLSNLQNMHGLGLYHFTDGYMPDPDLLAKRAKSLKTEYST